MSIAVGLTGVAEMAVTIHDTAIALGSGDVEVLGTPRLVALLEEATCVAIRGALPTHQTSVGSQINVRHRNPSFPGAQVFARATVIEVNGSRVTFEVSAAHVTGEGEREERIAVGTITRVLVERSAFAAG